ncbi:DUF6452 family protein [Fibrella aquatica]|uniref:DUF6452 family protein n=1 Tax=Fibrella aquatica TaxID=3242487 RepID=UPI00351FC69E
MNRLYVLVIIGIASMVIGCRKNCGPSDEPRLKLSINMQTAPALTAVYALNTAPGSPAMTLPQSTSAPNRTYWQLDLPLNLTADRAQYVFNRSGRLDTVTVNYRRKFAYEDVECGYTVTILPPLNSDNTPLADSLVVKTTAGKLNSVDFIPTSSRTFFIRESNTGISVGLLWL